MISYEPPKQEAFGVGDYIDGLGTVLDPDDGETTAFIEEMASRARRSRQATAQAEKWTKEDECKQLTEGV